jgi:DNA-binding NarL/FixJ family response regulator
MTAQPTARELEVLAACLRQGSQKAAAYELGIAVQTVKNTTSGLYRKLDVDSAGGAAEALGWLTLPEMVPKSW